MNSLGSVAVSNRHILMYYDGPIWVGFRLHGLLYFAVVREWDPTLPDWELNRDYYAFQAANCSSSKESASALSESIALLLTRAGPDGDEFSDRDLWRRTWSNLVRSLRDVSKDRALVWQLFRLDDDYTLTHVSEADQELATQSLAMTLDYA